MNINWNYDTETNTVKTITQDGMALEFHFDSVGNVEHWNDGGGDYYPTYDQNKMIYVKYDNSFISMYEMMIIAEANYDVMNRQAEADDYMELEYQNDVSSLEMNGRV